MTPSSPTSETATPEATPTNTPSATASPTASPNPAPTYSTVTWKKGNTLSAMGGPHHIATSDDGKIAYTGGSTGNGQIFKSTDYGMNWAAVGPASSYGYDVFATSSDGSKVIGLEKGTRGRISTDGGSTWTYLSSLPNVKFYTVDMSSDGKKIIATGENHIWTSEDTGSTWTRQDTSILGKLYASASDDGKRL